MDVAGGVTRGRSVVFIATSHRAPLRRIVTLEQRAPARESRAMFRSRVKPQLSLLMVIQQGDRNVTHRRVLRACASAPERYTHVNPPRRPGHAAPAGLFFGPHA